MPGLIPTATVTAFDIGSTFGLMLKPPHCWRESPGRIHAANGFALSSLLRDEVSGYLLLQPQHIPQDTLKANWDFSSASDYAQTYSPQTGKYELMFLKSAANAFGYASTQADLVEDPCFYLNFSSWVPPHAATRSPTYIYRYIEFPSDYDIRYRICLEWTRPLRLEKTNDNGVSWHTLDEATPEGGWETLWRRSGGHVTIAVFTLEDTLEVFFGEANARAVGFLRYRTPDQSRVQVEAGKLKVSHKNGMVRWGYYPVRFPLAGTLVSATVDAGFPLTTVPECIRSRVYGRLKNVGGTVLVANGLTANHTITVDLPEELDAEDAGYLPGKLSYRYRLDYAAPNAGDGYADHSPLLKDLTIYHRGVAAKALMPAPSLNLTEKVLGIQENLSFDLDTLSVRAQYVITFSNRHGEFRQRLPECAMEIGLGWCYEDGSTLPTAPLQRRLLGRTGLLHTYSRPQAPLSTYTITVCDRALQLEKSRLRRDPYLDGTYHAYAVGWLAEYGGILPEFLRDDLTAGPVDGTPLLPIGVAGRSALEHRPGMSCWEAMHDIRRRYGHCLYFNRDAQLRYHEFIPLDTPPTSKWFDEVETPTPGSDPILNGIWQLSEYTVDLSPVRNNFSVLGYSIQDGLYILGHLQDEDSVFNPAAPNYVGGMVVDWVDADPFYTSPEICNAVVAQNYSVYRMPVETVRFGTWGQPGLFPLDVVEINERTAVPYGRRWAVLGMSSSFTRRPLLYTTSLVGRDLSPMGMSPETAVLPWGTELQVDRGRVDGDFYVG